MWEHTRETANERKPDVNYCIVRNIKIAAVVLDNVIHYQHENEEPR
jgi:hypothetical protein